MSRIDVMWLPLGAGSSGVVRWSGRAYEAWHAWREHRSRAPLFHAALLMGAGDRRFAVEMGPAWARLAPGAAVAVVGPVGGRWLGHSRWFRYQVRCSSDGWLPDAAYATAVVPVSTERRAVDAVLSALPSVPTLTWGRDQHHAGEMWNSNSVVAWLLTVAGVDAGALLPPGGGRAPGWAAGVVVARGGR